MNINSPENLIPQGRWFRPFKNYDQIPYQVNKPDYFVREIAFPIESCGLLNIDIVWTPEELLDMEEGENKKHTFILTVLKSEHSQTAS